MAPDSPIRGHHAMKPWDHPRVMEGHRMPSMAIGGHAWPRLVSLSRLALDFQKTSIYRAISNELKFTRRSACKRN